jgi:hypothetical protein
VILRLLCAPNPAQGGSGVYQSYAGWFVSLVYPLLNSAPYLRGGRYIMLKLTAIVAKITLKNKGEMDDYFTTKLTILPGT